MPIVFACPSCTKRVSVSRKYAGKRGPCPSCSASIVIPTVDTAVISTSPSSEELAAIAAMVYPKPKATLEELQERARAHDAAEAAEKAAPAAPRPHREREKEIAEVAPISKSSGERRAAARRAGPPEPPNPLVWLAIGVVIGAVVGFVAAKL